MNPQPSILQSWRKRVAKANTPADLAKLETSLTRLWDAGTLTIADFRRMDQMVCDRRNRLTI